MSNVLNTSSIILHNHVPEKCSFHTTHVFQTMPVFVGSALEVRQTGREELDSGVVDVNSITTHSQCVTSRWTNQLSRLGTVISCI